MWTTDIEAFGTVGAVIAALAVPLTNFGRRPRLSLSTDREGVHTRLEAGSVPWLRLVVKNARGRRAAEGVRVFVEHYRQVKDGEPVSMGNPELGWPSNLDPNVVVFAGAKRPIDLGYLQVARRQEGQVILTMAGTSQILATGGRWELHIALAGSLQIIDQREWLPPVPEGYVLRLLVGADDGAPRTYDVSVDWNGAAASPEQALESITLDVKRR